STNSPLMNSLWGVARKPEVRFAGFGESCAFMTIPQGMRSTLLVSDGCVDHGAPPFFPNHAHRALERRNYLFRARDHLSVRAAGRSRNARVVRRRIEADSDVIALARKPFRMHADRGIPRSAPAFVVEDHLQ